jgi:hypothetical protein
MIGGKRERIERATLKSDPDRIEPGNGRNPSGRRASRGQHGSDQSEPGSWKHANHDHPLIEQDI